ncbi:helix-turn-helix domain-containing protein [Actinoplanes sp. NPDC049118]|uniref:PucR family transcriptional regulator n=1 Tax=Actinoplanes sp. NPDC049118 TaxID=3155769 RepID=UPI00340F4279
MDARRLGVYMAEVAELFEADLDSIESETDAAIMEIAPVLSTDPAIMAELRASTRSILRRFVALGRHVDDPPPVEVPPEALDIARTLVRRGIEVDAAYRSYRRGQQVAWQRWRACAETVVGLNAGLVTVLDVSLQVQSSYLDLVLGRVIAEMHGERDAIVSGDLTRRTEAVRLILDGAPLDDDVASRRLRYDLSRHHTGLVLWSEGTEVRPGLFESTASALARAIGARPPLVVSAGPALLWAWIASADDSAARELPEAAESLAGSVRVAIGPARPGRAGFRRTHEAALSVYGLLAGNSEGGRVATYQTLEVTALAAHDQRRATDFVRSTLGPLAEDTPAAARLRETLRVFLEEAENAPRAAQRLHTHRNTVLQRVARATELLGYRPGDRRLAVELALELRRWLSRPAG